MYNRGLNFEEPFERRPSLYGGRVYLKTPRRVK